MKWNWLLLLLLLEEIEYQMWWQVGFDIRRYSTSIGKFLHETLNLNFSINVTYNKKTSEKIYLYHRQISDETTNRDISTRRFGVLSVTHTTRKP